MTEENKNTKPKSHISFYNLISDIYLCKKFINILLNLTALRKPKWLNPYHFKLINDKSYINENFQTTENINFMRKNSTLRNVWKNFRSGISHFFISNKIGSLLRRKTKAILVFVEKLMEVYDPTQNFTIIWDFLLMFLIIYFFVLIPFEMSFTEFPEYINHSFQQYGIIFLVLDMLKSINTAYYNKGTLVTNRREVLKKYLNDDFSIDLITILPLMIDFYFGFQIKYFRFLNMLFFLKYSHFKRIRERMEELVFLDENFISLVQLVFRILLFSHIFACIWYYIGTLTSESWIYLANLSERNWISLYIILFISS